MVRDCFLIRILQPFAVLILHIQHSLCIRMFVSISRQVSIAGGQLLTWLEVIGRIASHGNYLIHFNSLLYPSVIAALFSVQRSLETLQRYTSRRDTAVV